MLVLSRRLGESIVIDDQVVLTVALLADERVELSLIKVSGTCLGSFTLHANEFVSITDGVRAIVVRLEGDKVRLGIDAPSDVRIERGEFWDHRR